MKKSFIEKNSQQFHFILFHFNFTYGILKMILSLTGFHVGGCSCLLRRGTSAELIHRSRSEKLRIHKLRAKIAQSMLRLRRRSLRTSWWTVCAWWRTLMASMTAVKTGSSCCSQIIILSTHACALWRWRPTVIGCWTAWASG